MIAIQILVGLLFVLGIAGSFLPFVPGTLLIWIAALIFAIATDFQTIGIGRLVVLGVLVGLAYVVDYLAGAVGIDRLGGSRWAMLGAILGALVGLFFGLPGLILGPLVGAMVFELIHSRNLWSGLRSGMGTLFGALLGAAAKFSLAVIMVCLFLWWTWLSAPGPQ
jgi:uncharacterized protein